MLRTIRFFALLLCCWGSYWGAYGQASTEVGSPPARMFLPGQYGAHSQNFALAQDRRGVVYVGNFAGVLEYDGVGWRTIPTANITKVSALLAAASGTVYVGGNGEFGYLQPDSVGAFRFRSLSERGARQPRLTAHFDEVLAVLEAPDGVYFVARDAIFRWDGHAVREWASPAPITSAFQQGNTLWIFQKHRGLSSFSKGTWQPISLPAGTPALDNLVAMLPLPGAGNQALLVTGNQGLFELAGHTIRPFASAANEYLKASPATAAAVLADRSIVVATARGLVQLGAAGRGNQPIAGLGAQSINALLATPDGSLWLALNNGLLQLEIPTPLTLFPEAAQQMGEVLDIRRVNGRLFVAAANGLFSLHSGGLRPVPGVGSSSGLAAVGQQLYAATSRGVYRVVAGQAQALTQEYAICLAASQATPNCLYVGTQSGLGVLTVPAGQPATYQVVPGIKEQIFGVREATDGSVWLETLKAGLYRVLPGGQVRRYTAAQGLPTLLYNHTARLGQELLAYNDHGIFRYNPATDKFEIYNPFGNHRVAENWKNEFTPDAAGNVWTVGGDLKTITLYRPKGQGYTAVTAPFLPLSTVPIDVIYPDSAGVTWLGGRDGLVRYDATAQKSYALPYQALIRQVQTVGGRILYNGTTPLRNDTARTAELPAGTHDVHFTFAATTFPVVQGLAFQYQLENYDRIPSDWTTASQKEYTNLPPGQYRFRVTARNIYGTLSRAASYSFVVLAPWYTRWWALALGAMVAGLAIAWLVRWRLAAVVREKQALETLIQERTEEVVSQKAELEKQSTELADKNDQLEKIDLIVQSINAEVDSTNLFQLVLAKFSVIRHMHSASFLVFDKEAAAFHFKALRGSRHLSHVQAVALTLAEAEQRFLANATEVYEDVYLSNPTNYLLLGSAIDDLPTPKSLVTIVIQDDGRVEGFITLENNARPDAFDQLDLDLIRNLREHLIAAFIKTRLLESLENTLSDLENTQGELIRQEKLASVGQLTKGIVDRILNPLNYVTNFSQASDELIADVVDMLERQQHVLSADALEEILDELSVVKDNSVKIQEHSFSTTRILKDMKKLLKEKSRDFEETDLNSYLSTKAPRAMLQEQGSEPAAGAIKLVLDLAPTPVMAHLLTFEFGQVVQHLISNACYTLAEKTKALPGFRPELVVRTRLVGGQAVWQVRDNGRGIPAREQAKLFSPFFTTKPTAKGSGLGLYMAKDIIETHKGTITLESVEGEFTEITITLPAALG